MSVFVMDSFGHMNGGENAYGDYIPVGRSDHLAWP